VHNTFRLTGSEGPVAWLQSTNTRNLACQLAGAATPLGITLHIAAPRRSTATPAMQHQSLPEQLVAEGAELQRAMASTHQASRYMLHLCGIHYRTILQPFCRGLNK
jgi:hypothetical protein